MSHEAPCPDCQSNDHRCYDGYGNKIWPWHIRRIVAYNATHSLTDDEWVQEGPYESLGFARAVLAAYLAGVEDGPDRAVIDTLDVLPRLAAATSVLAMRAREKPA